MTEYVNPHLYLVIHVCGLLQNWIGETILEDFQEDFVVDIEAEYVRGYVCIHCIHSQVGSKFTVLKHLFCWCIV